MSFIAGYLLGLGDREAVIEPLTVTENGGYTAPEGVDGFNPVIVKVPQGSDSRLSAILSATELANVAVTDEWSVSVRMSDLLNGEYIDTMSFSITGSVYVLNRQKCFWSCYFKNGTFMFAIPTVIKTDNETHYTPADGSEYMSRSTIYSDFAISKATVNKHSSGQCYLYVSYTAVVTGTDYNPDGTVDGTPAVGQASEDDRICMAATGNVYYDPYIFTITRGGADTYISDVWDLCRSIATSAT